MALIVISVALWARYEYIPPFADRHVEVAAERYDLDISEPGAWFSAWSLGDGQAFAVIAADPSGVKLSGEIKEPAYRYTRAGYGWAATLGSLGRETWIPYGLAVVGTLAIVGTLALAARLRDRLGARAWLIVANPALYLGFAGDTAEPLGIFLLVWALGGGSLIASALLGITRPSYLVALAGRLRQIVVGVIATIAILVYGFLRFSSAQFVPDGGRVAVPFTAYLENSSLLGWVLAALAVVTLLVGIWRKDWAWGAAALLVVSLGTDVTLDPVNAWRAAGMLPVLWAFGPGYQAVKGRFFGPVRAAVLSGT